jgi:dCMP deaminase
MGRLTNDQYWTSLLPGLAARSTCVRRQVGAIITDDRHRILSSGFNGVPASFPHCGEQAGPKCPNNHQYWDGDRCIRCGKTCNEISHETRTRELVLCNGAFDEKGDTRRCNAVHAEMNAIMDLGAKLRDAYTLYVSCTPCRQCALVICNTPIQRVIALERYADDSAAILAARNIRVIVIGEA